MASADDPQWLQDLMQVVSTTHEHPSAARLLEGARKATQHLPPSRQVQTFLQVRKALGSSSATMANWKARGVSEQAALEAERLWGVPAAWILTGAMPPRWGAPAAPVAPGSALVAALDALQAALGAAPPDMRDELGEALQSWARRGGRDAYRRTVEALLDEALAPSGKRRAAGT